MITTDAELIEAVNTCGAMLQEITDYVSAEPGRTGRIRFPRGFLGTVGSHTARYPWMKDKVVQRNLAYQYLFGDVLRWVNNRTDISGLAKEMIIKHAIVGMGAISESLLAASVRQLGFTEARYPSRLKRLRNEGVLNDAVFAELDWLWQARNAIHIYEVTSIEIDKYQVADARRAYRAVSALEEALRAKFDV